MGKQNLQFILYDISHFQNDRKGRTQHSFCHFNYFCDLLLFFRLSACFSCSFVFLLKGQATYAILSIGQSNTALSVLSHSHAFVNLNFYVIVTCFFIYQLVCHIFCISIEGTCYVCYTFTWTVQYRAWVSWSLSYDERFVFR